MKRQQDNIFSHLDQNKYNLKPFSPVVWIALVLGLELLFVTGMIITVVYSEKQVRTALERQVRLERLQGDILHLDEVLTMSARMSAASGDLRWEERYKLYEPKLDKAITDALDLLPPNERSGMIETNTANARLVEMELAAFDAVRKGNKDEAQRLLFSPLYEQAKTNYALGLNQRFQLLDTLVADLIKDQKKQSLIVQISGLIGWGLLIIIWFLVIKNINHKRKLLVSTRLNLQRSQELLKERVHVMARELTKVENKERERIAKLLHDQLQQILVAARLHVHLLPETEEKHRTEFLLDEAIQASRTLTINLSPPALVSGNIIKALKWLVKWMDEQYHLQVSLQIEGEVTFVEKEIQVIIFDSIRELLFNVVKHAGVSTAYVKCKFSKDILIITVQDKGHGFDLKSTLSDQRFGLINTLKRIEFIGGQVDLNTAHGEGTHIQLKFPLSEKSLETSQHPIRIVLVDDHAIVREGIRLMLEQQQDMSVVGEASNLKETLVIVKENSPDIVLMDISLGQYRPNGIEVTKKLREAGYEKEIIVLSSYDSSYYYEVLKSLGVNHYLIKGDDMNRMLTTIRQNVG